MSRGRLTFLLVSLLVLLPLVGGAVLARDDQRGEDSLFKYLSVFQDVLRLVRQAYVDEVSVDQLMEGALDGAADALDPFSTFVPAGRVDDYRRVLEIGSRHSGLVIAKDRGVVYLISVVEGSPGAAAELVRGDILTAIGDEPTRRLPLWRIQSLLADEPGRVVDLSILRDGVASEVTLTLATYEPPLVELTRHDGVPVLRVTLFTEGTADAIARALEGLEPAERELGLLLDLREATSEDTESAFEVAELFASGDLGRLVSTDGVLESFTSEGEPLWGAEVVVLLGRGSIGASEVLAAVLQETIGAVVVGQPSFGHAGRLAFTPLAGGAHVLLTDAFYSAGPGGEALVEGVTPDIEVSERTRRFAERDLALEDLTLERAVGVLRGEAELGEAA